MADPQAVKTARRMLAIFWVFTALYLGISVALIMTRGWFGLIFIAILAYFWFFRGLPDTKPHFTVMREARINSKRSHDQAPVA